MTFTTTLSRYTNDCTAIINHYVADWFAPLGVVVNVMANTHTAPHYAQVSLHSDWLSFTVCDYNPNSRLQRGELTQYSAHNLAYVYCAWLKSSIAFRNNDTMKEYRYLCGVPKNVIKPAFRTNIFIQQFFNDESDVSFQTNMEQTMTLFPPSFVSPERDEIMRNEIDIPARRIPHPQFAGAPFEDDDERDDWIMDYAKQVHRLVHTSPAVRIIGMVVTANDVAGSAVINL